MTRLREIDTNQVRRHRLASWNFKVNYLIMICEADFVSSFFSEKYGVVLCSPIITID